MFLSKFLTVSGTLAFSAVGLAIVAESPAIGQERPAHVVTAPRVYELPTSRVSYADLNLASSAGEKTLYRRVGSAVEMVCPDLFGPIELTMRTRGCRQFAWTGAEPQIKQAVMRAREIASTGKSSIAVAAIQIHVPR